MRISLADMIERQTRTRAGRQPRVQAIDLFAGSIIARPVGGLWGLFYDHMGIYVGDDTVIHFNGETKKSIGAVLRKDSLDGFASGYDVRLHASPRNEAHARAVCAEAERLYRAERNRFNRRYDMVVNNCEDFCTTCYEVAYP